MGAVDERFREVDLAALPKILAERREYPVEHPLALPLLEAVMARVSSIAVLKPKDTCPAVRNNAGMVTPYRDDRAAQEALLADARKLLVQLEEDRKTYDRLRSSLGDPRTSWLAIAAFALLFVGLIVLCVLLS